MSKKLVIWALALSLSFGGLTASVFAADEARNQEPANTEIAKADGTAKRSQASCHKKKKHCGGGSTTTTTTKVKVLEEQIPTERAPDAKTPEAK